MDPRILVSIGESHGEVERSREYWRVAETSREYSGVLESIGERLRVPRVVESRDEFESRVLGGIDGW